jgi:preprotein translocase subunit YajC
MDPQALQSFLPIIVLFAIFYFLLIRPQQKQQKKRKEMLAALKKGDKVVTIGGIYGTIKELRDNDLTLRIGDNMDIRMARYSVDRQQQEE